MTYLLAAWLISGLASVSADMRLPFHERPAYARRRRIGTGMFMVLLGWFARPLFHLGSPYGRVLAVRGMGRNLAGLVGMSAIFWLIAQTL